MVKDGGSNYILILNIMNARKNRNMNDIQIKEYAILGPIQSGVKTGSLFYLARKEKILHLILNFLLCQMGP